MIIKKETLKKLLILWLFCGVLSAYFASSNKLLHLTENQIFYLSSTTSQVLAAVFGLVIVALVFALERIGKEEFFYSESFNLSRKKLIYSGVKKEIIKEFKLVFIYITALSLITFFLANFTIATAVENQQELNRNLLNWLNSFCLNFTQFSFFIVMAFVSYFIYAVLNIDSDSQEYGREIEQLLNKTTKGNSELFKKDVEDALDLVEKYFTDNFGEEFEVIKKNSFDQSNEIKKILSSLKDKKIINEHFYQEILEIIQIKKFLDSEYKDQINSGFGLSYAQELQAGKLNKMVKEKLISD